MTPPGEDLPATVAQCATRLLSTVKPSRQSVEAVRTVITMGTVAATGPKRSTENLAAGRDAMIGIC